MSRAKVQAFFIFFDLNRTAVVPTTEYSGVALPADPFLLVPAVVADGTVTGTKGVKVMKGDGSYYTIQ